jgi:hypothetical protein
MTVSKIILSVVCIAGLLPTTLKAAEASLELPVNSAYVWRGQVYNNEPVFEPSLTVSTKYGLSFNTWANFNLTDNLGKDSEKEFNEVDLTVSYDLPLEILDLTVGVVEYTYPHQTIQDDDDSVRASPGTREVYVTVGKEDLPLSPSAGVYYDCDEVNGVYGLVSVRQDFEVTKEFSIDATLSLGAANTDYNEAYFGLDDNALNDGNVKVGASYTLNESLSFNGYVMYTYLLDSSIRDAAKANDAYFNKGDILSGGVSLGYNF